MSTSPHPSPYLPDELLVMIFRDVDGRSMARSRQVSRQWCRCADTETLWRAAVAELPKPGRDEKLPAVLPPLAPPALGSWQGAYKLEVTLARAHERVGFWRAQARNARNRTWQHRCPRALGQGVETSMEGLLTMVRAVTLGPLATAVGVGIGALGGVAAGAGVALGCGLVGIGVVAAGFAVAELGVNVARDSLSLFASTAALARKVVYGGVETVVCGPVGALEQVRAAGLLATAVAHLPGFLKHGVSLCQKGHQAHAALQTCDALRARHNAAWRGLGEPAPGANDGH